MELYMKILALIALGVLLYGLIKRKPFNSEYNYTIVNNKSNVDDNNTCEQCN